MCACIDLTSLHDPGENVHHPEFSGEILCLEKFFERPLTNVTELIVIGEQISTAKIGQFGTVAENV